MKVDPIHCGVSVEGESTCNKDAAQVRHNCKFTLQSGGKNKVHCVELIYYHKLLKSTTYNDQTSSQ